MYRLIRERSQTSLQWYVHIDGVDVIECKIERRVRSVNSREWDEIIKFFIVYGKRIHNINNTCIKTGSYLTFEVLESLK